ncbi:CPBP family intramembrane glutamic endopeptidase [Micromonospora echinospora]|uniref:CPBP family intramembrane glutamic endopeptidase n=1 Tax=Micromonospora echinospora TaxID=1877 RepID=UPI0037ABEA0E
MSATPVPPGTPAGPRHGGGPNRRPARADFPLYDGRPVRLTGGQWAVLMGAVVVAAAADLLVALPGPPWLSVAVRGVLFFGIPLLVLSRLAPGTLSYLFQPVRPKDVGLMVAFAAINLVLSFVIAFVVSAVFDVNSNPANDTLAGLGTFDRLAYFASTVPQLIGEEVFTVLPFLALLTLATAVLGTGRRAGLVLAVIGSAVLFAAIHLPTYDWNVAQCLLVIGTARVVLLIPYLITKNLWTSVGAHVLNDWTLFGLGLLTAQHAS